MREQKPRTRRTLFFKRRVCFFCKDKIDSVDYKDIERLKRYVNERGKMMSSRGTGNCAKHQRMIAVAIKRAREIALLPYATE
ncbi:MAG: 30S ribosomal protein S18 [Candidatus Omnitrophota bacterium]